MSINVYKTFKVCKTLLASQSGALLVIWFWKRKVSIRNHSLHIYCYFTLKRKRLKDQWFLVSCFWVCFKKNMFCLNQSFQKCFKNFWKMFWKKEFLWDKTSASFVFLKRTLISNQSFHVSSTVSCFWTLSNLRQNQSMLFLLMGMVMVKSGNVET